MLSTRTRSLRSSRLKLSRSCTGRSRRRSPMARALKGLETESSLSPSLPLSLSLSHALPPLSLPRSLPRSLPLALSPLANFHSATRSTSLHLGQSPRVRVRSRRAAARSLPHTLARPTSASSKPRFLARTSSTPRAALSPSARHAPFVSTNQNGRDLDPRRAWDRCFLHRLHNGAAGGVLPPSQ